LETGPTFATKIFKKSTKKQEMKKLFALLMVAGTFAMYSCGGGHKEEAATDSTAVEATTMDTAAAVMDTAAVDTTAAAPAADSAAH
jgi:hypothetical protein